MSYNNVEIFVDDERKALLFGETLTSGSTYNVIVKEGKDSVGEGSLILMLNDSIDRDPAVVASCSLKHNTTDSDNDVSGTLNLSTDKLAGIALRRPGAMLSAYAVLHSDTTSQNVADGNVTVKLIPVATGSTSGSAVLFKGDKGDPGVGISSIEDGGTDSDGNKTVVFKFSNGRQSAFKIPKGERGLPAKMTAVYNSSTNMWYQVQLVSDPASNGLVLSVDSNGVDLSDLGTSEVYALEAKGYAQTAKDSKDAAVTAKSEAVAARNAAVSAAESASASATSASTAGSEAGAASGATAGANAAQSVIDANLTTIQGYVSSSSSSASSASSSATSASLSESSALAYKGQCETFKNSAEAAAQTAISRSESLDPDSIEYVDRSQEISAVKTFTESPIVPDIIDTEDGSSEAASVNYVGGKIDDAVISVFPYIPLSVDGAKSISTSAISISGEASVDSVVFVLLVKSNASSTVTLSISYDGGSTWKEVDFSSGSVVALKKSATPGGVVCKVKASYSGVYKYYRAAYSNIKFSSVE